MTLFQRFVMASVNGVMKVAAACGSKGAKDFVTSQDAYRLQVELMDKVHNYAELHHISHEEAAKRLGVAVPQELLDEFRRFDPIHWHEEYP